MKFSFKIQKYQKETVDSLVKCFDGRQFADKVQYLRDKGLMPKLVKQEVQTELFDEQMLKRVQHDVKQKQCHPDGNNVIPNLFRNLRRKNA